jgi:hypothetical protein
MNERSKDKMNKGPKEEKDVTTPMAPVSAGHTACLQSGGAGLKLLATHSTLDHASSSTSITHNNQSCAFNFNNMN